MSARTVATRAVSWGMLLAVVAGALALIVVPKLNDAKPLTVLSGSMSGTYEIGDALIVRPVDPTDLRVGDVITFQPVSDDPSLTTHRITAIAYGSEGRSFITQGDANGAVDPEPIMEAQVMGEVWYSVPLVGYASVWMAGDWAQTAIHALAGLFLLYGAYLVGAGILEHLRGDGSRPPRSEPRRTPRAWPTSGMARSFHLAFASAAVLAVTASLILVVGPPARAAGESPRLLVGSSAGGPFLDQLPTALFADADLVSPGSEVGDRFWVKNNSSADARVTVAVIDDEPENELEAATGYELAIGRARTPGGETPGGTGPCLTLTSDGVVAPGQVVPVRVTARVGDLVGQTGMGQQASVDLRVSLTRSTGGIEVCGEEAEADPEPASHGQGEDGEDGQDGGGADPVDCTRDVVVTTAGTPTCVPTSVEAGVGAALGDGVGGAGAGDTRPAAVAVGLLGGVLLLWAKRRRRLAYAPRHRG